MYICRKIYLYTYLLLFYWQPFPNNYFESLKNVCIKFETSEKTFLPYSAWQIQNFNMFLERIQKIKIHVQPEKNFIRNFLFIKQTV